MEYQEDEDVIKYHKPNAKEVYHVRKRRPVPEVRNISLWLLVPFLLTLVLGAYLTFYGLGIDTSGQTTYKVTSNADYQVYLKDNNYYTEKYLEAGKQYIANLIDTIRVDYEYKLEADEDVDANYSYEIVATAMATDRDSKKQVLYEKSDKLKAVEIKPMEDGQIKITDKVNIDYGKYSAYMRNFRSDFGLAADCFLNLKLVVKVDGAIKTEDTLGMNIPLSDQTLDISISADEINREEKVGDAKYAIYVKNQPVLIAGGAMAAASLIAVILVIYLYKTRYGDNWYAEAEDKINKFYDTRIVNADADYHEDGEVVRVGEFLELIDASEAEGAPIVRYDVDPEYKAYYIVRSANGLTTYRYTLSREYQDELRESGQGKERFA